MWWGTNAPTPFSVWTVARNSRMDNLEESDITGTELNYGIFFNTPHIDSVCLFISYAYFLFYNCHH
jgi:hypothetical protein